MYKLTVPREKNYFFKRNRTRPILIPVPCLDDAFVPIQDRSKGLERDKSVCLNTWTEPVPIQPGPPQHL